MADQTDISQLTIESAADSSDAQISQAVIEVAAEGGPALISQAVLEAAASASGLQISQLTIELARGPEVVPPTDTPSSTFVFDEGLGTSYYLVPQLTDSGNELRDKEVKSVSVRGKVTNASYGVFGYGATEDVDVAAIKAGNINSRTGVRVLPDTTMVQQSKRFPVSVKNITNHTVRVQGRWDGVGIRDRIDEIVYEVAIRGVRR